MTFFVVKIIESNEIVVVPVHWYQFNDNKCAWPIKDAQNRAERKEVFSTRWPRYIAKVISSHGNADTEVSDSARTFREKEKSCSRPKRTTVNKKTIPEDVYDESDDERLDIFAHIDGGAEDLASMWSSPSPLIENRVEEVLFPKPASQTTNWVDPAEVRHLRRSNSPQSDKTLSASSLVPLDTSSGKRKERDDEDNGICDMEDDSCNEPSSKARKIMDNAAFQREVLKNFSKLFSLTRGIGRDIQDIKSDNRDIRHQLRKNFQAASTADTSTSDKPTLSSIRIIRSLGGNDLGTVLRTAWRYFMSDELLNQLTWKGEHKANSKQLKDIKGLQTYRLPSVIYNAIKEEGGIYANVSLSDLNKLSAEFVTKAGTRLAAKQKKLLEKIDM
ncbi:hypothetical protein GHT06_007039 [Daphnia sinensis]|uniref:DUF4806 domain-containing protein n=1 Tax=Daphnia sinensis TaxID=1820382 RepID=A0AAD5KEY0_9CRUS|nr:hypothetical protein GHT06_007039 [Daphnia sinensis]